MSYKVCAFAIFSIILYTTTPTLAGVVRTDYTTNQPTEKSIDAALADTQTTESELPEITTVKYIAGEDVSSSEEDVTVKIAVASLDPAPGALEGIEITLETIEGAAAMDKKNEKEQKSNEDESNENETDTNKTAHSRDEAASIKVNAHETDDLAKEIAQSSVETIHEPQKSSKFLLLSTPRLAREQEENIAEPEDVDINTAVTTDETTELSIEVKAETDKPKEGADKKPGFIARVRDAIFGEKSAHEETTPNKAEEEKASEDNEKKQVKQNEQDVKKQDDTTTSTAAVEDTPTPHNSNAASAVLTETEPEYVIFDSDTAHFEHLGSFTHIDSDEHLQPIVHSVEEVPSHFEEPLLFTNSYVHAW